MMRWLVSALLMLDGLASGLRFAEVVAILSIYPPLTIGLLVCRTMVAALLFAAGLFLIQKRPLAPALGRTALLASASLAVAEIGWALSSTSIFPAFRWPAVALYWLYALSMAVWIGRAADARS